MRSDRQPPQSPQVPAPSPDPEAARPAAARGAAGSPSSAARARLGSLWLPALTLIAGLAWLSLTSALAAEGRRIADLEEEHASLLERRARALTAHAAATDPRALEARALALGFGPGAAVETIGVDARLLAAPAQAGDPGSPLDIMRQAALPGGAADDSALLAGGASDMPGLLLSVGAASAAEAAERPAPGAGAP